MLLILGTHDVMLIENIEAPQSVRLLGEGGRLKPGQTGAGPPSGRAAGGAEVFSCHLGDSGSDFKRDPDSWSLCGPAWSGCLGVLTLPRGERREGGDRSCASDG